MSATPGFESGCVSALGRIPSTSRPWSRGWCAAVAGILEAAAAKPGNVHPGQSFADLTFADLVAAAIATGPPLDDAPRMLLGEIILAAVREARATTGTNANLGIVLLLAPLAAAAGPPTPQSVEAVFGMLGPADSALIWEAINLARPGGLGRSERWDLAAPSPPDIRAAMRHAAGRDTIARLWADGFADLFAGPVADLAAGLATGLPLADAILLTFLRQLAREPDSLILRRHGADVAAHVSRQAARIVAGGHARRWSAEVAAFDALLRAPRRLNPGTTADLVAAALYILLVDGRLRPALPFPAPPFSPA